MTPKFLQIVSSQNEELNRVQANVAEALRQIENRVTTAITTVNTNIYNALNETTAGTPREWDHVSAHTLVTTSNVLTTIASFQLAEGTVENWFVTISSVASDFSPAGDASSFGRGAVFYRRVGNAPVLLSTGGLWGAAIIVSQAVISVVAGVPSIQVAGQLNVPSRWTATVRRTVYQ